MWPKSSLRVFYNMYSKVECCAGAQSIVKTFENAQGPKAQVYTLMRKPSRWYF